LAEAYLAKTQQKKLLVQLPLPGPMGKAMREGELITAPGSIAGRQSFLEWLEAIDAA